MKFLSNFEKIINSFTFTFQNTYKAIFSGNSLNADRTYTLPNESGELALTSTSTKLLYGTGVPDNGDGIDDNLYIDTLGFVLYKKESGVWNWVGEAILSGGTTGQVLAKVDGTDYNVEWATPSGGGGVSNLSVDDIPIPDGPITILNDNGTGFVIQNSDGTLGGQTGLMTGTQAVKLESLNTSAQIPAGGSTGQVLSKINGTDFNVEWTSSSGGGVSESLAIAYAIAF